MKMKKIKECSPGGRNEEEGLRDGVCGGIPPRNPFPYTPLRFVWPLKKFRADLKMASIGSCFSDSLSGRLSESGFRVVWNPNGILYNPVSIRDALFHAAEDVPYTEKDFFEADGLWHSWLHHGCFSRPSRAEALHAAETSRIAFRHALLEAGAVLITESSALLYEVAAPWGEGRRDEDGGGRRIAANCHRMPGKCFIRRLATREELEHAVKESVALVRRVNPSCSVILTLSPVRHYPGDLLLNSRSKAMLLSAIHEAVGNTDNCAYFPAYEILMDELRDYRFYAPDMLHPSPLAEEIILTRFLSLCFEPEAMLRFRESELLRRKNAHIERRPFLPSGTVTGGGDAPSFSFSSSSPSAAFSTGQDEETQRGI